MKILQNIWSKQNQLFRHKINFNIASLYSLFFWCAASLCVFLFLYGSAQLLTTASFECILGTACLFSPLPLMSCIRVGSRSLCSLCRWEPHSGCCVCMPPLSCGKFYKKINQNRNKTAGSNIVTQ